MRLIPQHSLHVSLKGPILKLHFQQDLEGDSILTLDVDWCRWDQTVERLVRMGVDVNAKNDVDMTALHYAAVGALNAPGSKQAECALIPCQCLRVCFCDGSVSSPLISDEHKLKLML